MKTFLALLATVGFVMGAADFAEAKSDKSANGKAVGQQERGEDDNGASANAPGKTGATGKDNAPGKNK